MFSQGLQLFENYNAFMVTGQHNTITCNREGILPMSIGFSGLDTPCCLQPVTIEVSSTHPLIQLAQVIPWQALAEMVLPDLKRTTPKGKWWLGRKLTLRIHLGVLLLQWLYNLTDRQVEWALKDNAAYQLFCGRGLIDPWHTPDHTKIEAFRSRLSPATQRQVANVVAVWATELGFADPSAMDIDSTIQQANIAYPSDAHLMVKMVLLVHKVWTYMKQHMAFFADFLKLPKKLVAIASPVRKTLRTQFRTLLYRARQRKHLRVFALGQRLRHFVDHVTATAGPANGARVRRWVQDKKAGWYAVLADPRMPVTSTLLDQAHNAIERKLFAMKGFHHPGGSHQAFLTGLAHLYNLVPYQRRAQHAGQCGVEVEGGTVPTRDWFLNLQILTSGGFR